MANETAFQTFYHLLTICLQENITVMEDLALTFLLLLMQIWHKSHDSEYRPDLSASLVRFPKRVNEVPQAQVLTFTYFDILFRYISSAYFIIM